MYKNIEFNRNFNILNITYNNKLRYYERFCLDEWKKHLNNDSKIILERQLSIFDYFSRVPHGLKTVFYSIRDPELKSWTKKVFLAI